MSQPVQLTLNGRPRTWLVEIRRLAVHQLRDVEGDYSIRIGCDTAQCGACTVLVDGLAVKSCNLLAVQLHGSVVQTLRGVAQAENHQPLLDAFERHHALQCGYCTSGMVVTAAALLDDPGTAVDEQTVRNELHGNLCRCTGYQNIVTAILDAARARAGQP